MKKKLIIGIYFSLALSLFAAAEQNITVLEFTADSETAKMKTLVSDYIAVLVSENDNYHLLNAIDRDVILEDKSINTANKSNLEIARNLPVEMFVQGSLASENGYKLQLSLINTRTGKKIQSSSGNYTNLDSLLRDCENLTDILFGKAVASASSGSGSGSGSSASNTYKSKIFGSDYSYTYKGDEYNRGGFPALADEIVEAMPESSRAKAYRENLNKARTSDSVLLYGGAGLAISGVTVGLLTGMGDDGMTTISWVGVGIGALGLIIEMIGAFSESEVPIMADMVEYYNGNI